jgi:chemotaxis protein MotB
MKKTLIFPVLALSFLFACVSQGTYDTKAKEAEDLSAQVASLRAQTEDLSKQVEALKKERESLQTQVNELSQKAEKAEQLEKATQTYQDLQKKLEKEIQDGKVKITEMKNRLTMTMVDKIIFPSGSTEISKDGKQVLDKVISILKDIKDKRIQVEGHTDNVRIVSALKKRYPTNWELSTARATEVVRYLQEAGGLDAGLLSATGFAEYQPVAANDTDEGRLQNRRIEIVLLPLLK